jgi:phosphopantothenoylcysteine decarboxylase / phosphopantothenate---cysteine ligase
MARILIGVSGGIAAYKTVETVRLLIRAGHTVRVVQTPNSRRFVGTETFAGITGAPVLCEEFEPDPLRGAYPGETAPERSPITHLALAQRADLYLIAPASANTIAKLAQGLADNLVTAAALAADCALLVAPAMNDRMYTHAATQDNLALLRARGTRTIGPDAGELASHGEHGIGRMSEPEEIAAACERLLAPQLAAAGADWRGIRVLVTAGGTREPIDPVRYIGNRSSGRMGIELAAAAARRGAVVTVVAANVSLPVPSGVRVVEVQTAAELLAACEARFDAADVLLMAAAVADFRPSTAAVHKLKKDSGPPDGADHRRARHAGAAAPARAGARRLRRRDRGGSDHLRTREAAAQATGRDRRQRCRRRGHRLRQRRQRGDDHHRRRRRAAIGARR